MTQLFISSVQKEFQEERYAIRDFVNKDALLSQFFTVFLFEDLPPVDQRPDEVYLDEVKDSPIYVGLFGNQYGNWRDENGLSPTEKEYRLATELRTRRLVLVKQGNDPEPEMKNLINRAGDELVRKRFGSTEEMLSLLHRSLIQYLRDEGVITTKEFDAQTYEGASLADMVPEKIRRFLELAKAERSYALSLDSSIETVLAHLDLLADGRPTKGALLLFGDRPKRHVSGADINCLHFHGTEVVKPIPSQQVYQGTVFEMVDAAVDFVMSKLTRRVVPSSQKVASDVEYDIPYKVVREAIVNALAHRSYTSKAGVQVMLFADRLEVWNSGGLPEDLTIAQLRKPHRSVPRNRLLCEPLYLARYIERAGTGTLDMIKFCTAAGLPEPQFRSEGEHFVTTIWRDWLTDDILAGLGLNERQMKAIKYLKAEQKITNTDYQTLTDVARTTAKRDLEELVKLKLVHLFGAGRSAHYRLCDKRPINGSNGPSEHGEINGP